MENAIIVRSPILPLCINSLIKQDKIDFVNNLIKLHYSKSIAHPLEDFSGASIILCK